MTEYERELRRARFRYLIRLGFAYALYLAGTALICLLLYVGLVLFLAAGQP